VRDLTAGHAYDSNNPPSFEPDLPLSGGHMITFRGEENDAPDPIRIVLTIRCVTVDNYFDRVYTEASANSTSGTEPKVAKVAVVE
jgi:hypothetical protein